jgi:hypothetical protein
MKETTVHVSDTFLQGIVSATWHCTLVNMAKLTEGLAVGADLVSRDLADLKEQLLVLVRVSVQVGRPDQREEWLVLLLGVASESSNLWCLIRVVGSSDGVLQAMDPFLHLLRILSLQHMNPIIAFHNDM